MSLAVVIIDMFNPYDHEDADALAANVEPIIEPIQQLVANAREAEADIIYVNDNHGDFAVSRHGVVQNALEGKRPDLIEPIVPAEDVEFLLKVRHSAFYASPLEWLLGRREIETVVLAGQTTDQCVLYSALDAYVRHFQVRVPTDCVAPVDHDLGDAALQMMERNMSVELVSVQDAVRPSPAAA